MKGKLSLAGVICILLFVFYFESDQDEFHHPSSLMLDSSDDAAEVSGAPDDQFDTYEKTYEYVYEETKQSGDYEIQFYQQYEIVLDEEGNEISRNPTGEYKHLRYKK